MVEDAGEAVDTAERIADIELSADDTARRISQAENPYHASECTNRKEIPVFEMLNRIYRHHLGR